jgi:hypothetical protein
VRDMTTDTETLTRITLEDVEAAYAEWRALGDPYSGSDKAERFAAYGRATRLHAAYRSQELGR